MISNMVKNYLSFKFELGQVAEGARARGASKIIGVDINPEKFIRGNFLSVV